MVLMCKIKLWEPQSFYRSGQTLSGTVLYSVIKPTEFLFAVLTLQGRAITEYRNSYGDRMNKEYIIFFKSLDILQKGVLLAGYYGFNFEFKLPYKIPSSFSSQYAKIKYYLEADFYKSFFPRKFKEHIKVYGIVKAPLEWRVYKIKKVLFEPLSTKHTVDVKVKLKKTLLKPGETAKLKIKVDNGTYVKVRAVKIELRRKARLKVCTLFCDRRIIKKKLIKECKTQLTDPVPAGNIAKFSIHIPIPKSLSTIQSCKNIVINYFFLVTVEMNFPFKNASVIVPVVIGETRSDRKKLLGLKLEPEMGLVKSDNNVQDKNVAQNEEGEVNSDVEHESGPSTSCQISDKKTYDDAKNLTQNESCKVNVKHESAPNTGYQPSDKKVKGSNETEISSANANLGGKSKSEPSICEKGMIINFTKVTLNITNESKPSTNFEPLDKEIQDMNSTRLGSNCEKKNKCEQGMISPPSDGINN